MNKNRLCFFTSACALVFSGASAVCQNVMPEVLDKGTLTEQMKYLEEKTRIYEEYRAIREDMFQKIKDNAIDSLNLVKGKITAYIGLTGSLNSRINSLKDSLNATQEELKETTSTKNRISVLGIGVNKITYNTIMWIIVAILAFLLAAGFLAFKRNYIVTFNTKNELKDLQTEFEEYRKKTRLEREKMSMDHFNEIRRLRGDKK
jgi:hypothetical protein